MQFFSTTQSSIAHQTYKNFMALLVRLYPQHLGDILNQHFAFSSAMNFSENLQKVDRIKTWLDSFWPLSPSLVAELKKLYDVRFTYHSNALEGNTLTQRETELVLQTGITVGGKTKARTPKSHRTSRCDRLDGNANAIGQCDR